MDLIALKGSVQAFPVFSFHFQLRQFDVCSECVCVLSLFTARRGEIVH